MANHTSTTPSKPNFIGIENDMGEASQWNFTSKNKLEDITIDADFAWLVFSLLIAMIWVTYITHYNSRVFGQILTRLSNRLIKTGFIRIGSLAFDPLAGKIMFRDIVYCTEDFTVRIQDGWLVFRWWRSYVPRDISEDLSHSDTRLSLLLNGLELHIFNRSQLYSHLEELFGLESLIMPADESHKNTPEKQSLQTKSEDNYRGSGILGRSWRDLIPVIKVDVCSGRAIFGNRLVPTTLCLSVEEAHLVYSTKQALSKLDHFMHIVKCRAENFKVTLAPSLKYTGLNDEPPRLMGDGFVILSSNKIDFYYYMDEPGLVPEVPEMIELANGDVVESSAPMWGLDIRCGKGTDFSYGPWADRRREQLYKFFYPQDYQPMKVTPTQRPGEKRAVQTFDIRFSTQAEATVDILFSKVKETNAVHMTIGAGSYLEITIPWTVKPDGYVTKISGTLLHVDASTSLQYRSLLEAETLKFSAQLHYPIIWNFHQSWNLSFAGTKATLHLIYEHRYFFQDLINDWSSRSPSDILHFVPYTWSLNFSFKEFELVTVANKYNWVDCSSQLQENAYVAFSGDFLELSFDLPFTDFLPETLDLKFKIQGESLDMNILLPEISTTRPMLLALAAHTRTASRFHDTESNRLRPSNRDKRWANFIKKNEGWVQCWTVPCLSIGIQYTYHPLSAPGPTPQANVPTPEREELLLTPVRFPLPNSSLKVPKTSKHIPIDFDPTTLNPDLVTVELELGPSELYVYGTVLRMFLHLKENIFGEDQRMADMDPSAALLDISGTKNESLNRSSDPIPDPLISIDDTVFDHRLCRPLHVNVCVTMHDIHAHLIKHCNKDDPPCPTVSLEKLTFEMHKTFTETRLQLLLSPAFLHSTDMLLRPLGNAHLQQGFMVLSGLQVRGHAMFSLAGRRPDEETLEYGWLIEAILGQLTGRLTLPQLHHIVAGLEAFVQLALDDENQLSPPKNQVPCHHGTPQFQCSYSTQSGADPSVLGTLCPTSEDIKYRMTRVSVDLIDVTLVESGTAFGLQVFPVRLSTCNLHSRQIHSGLSVLIPNVNIRQYLATSRSPTVDNSYTALNNSNQSKSDAAVKISSSSSTWNRTHESGLSQSAEELYVDEKIRKSPTSNRMGMNANFNQYTDWLEVGLIEMGPIYVDIGSSMDHCRGDLAVLQSAFLRLHDNRTRRLWFLWDLLSDFDTEIPESSNHQQSLAKCGCNGGCAFFGNNFNGRGFFESDDSGSYPALANPGRRSNDPAYGQSILRENSFLLDLLEDANPDKSAGSDVSNTSTIKNIDEVFIESDSDMPRHAFDDAHPDVESVPLIREIEDGGSKLHSSHHSLQNSKEKFRFDGFLTRHHPAAMSTPILLTSGSSGASRDDSAKLPIPIRRKRIFSQVSLPLLSDPTEGPLRSRSSKSTQSESRSELYFSAEDEDDEADDKEYDEDAESSSDELLSLSTHLPSRSNQLASSATEPPDRSSQRSNSVSNSTKRSSSILSSRNSNVSFNSAVSSAADFSLVDLHLQTARPVVDSPILLASYITHLSEIECTNWSAPAPKTSSDCKFKRSPTFVTTKKGFTSFRLVDRPTYTPNVPNGPGSKGFAFSPQRGEEKHTNFWEGIQEEKNGLHNDATTVFIKIDRSVNVMFCPLTLESAQRFAESLIPTLEQLHPLTVMMRVHRRCVSHVESHNPMKKERTAILEQKEPKEAVYQDVTQYHLRGSLQIPRINLCLLQAGIVEQIISLSALDNPRDLVCVSSVAICVDSLSLHFSKSVQENRIVQAVCRPPTETHLTKKSKSKTRQGNSIATEVAFVESSLIDNEQLMVSGNLGKIHLQLRRLNNDVSPQLPENVTATVIPTNCSRVLFHYASEQPSNICRQSSFAAVVNEDINNTEDQDRFGVVMFECGLQGLHLRAVKRLNGEDKGSRVTMEIETSLPQTSENSTERQTCDAEAQPQPVAGSLTSHSSHISFKMRSEKGTSTPEQQQDRTEPPKPPPPQQQHEQPQPQPHQPHSQPQQRISVDEQDVSSCSLQIRAVWFSFAAPPRTTPAKKSDLAILDRNLLSTASPAINAWMNSGDRLTVTVSQLCRVAESRVMSVLAGLMVEALDAQNVHLPVKSKYSCLSLMSRTLQEDPSCQLNVVLHRYVLLQQNDWAALEARLSPSVIPPLSTLKQGVIVLSRQWKNALYTPFMLTYSLRQTKIQKTPNVFQTAGRTGKSQSIIVKDGVEVGGEEEKTLLLTTNDPESPWVSSNESSMIFSTGDLNASMPLLGSSNIPSPPTLSALKRKIYSTTGLGDSYELKTLSPSSGDDGNDGEDEESTGKNNRKEEDLYSWMARQQRGTVKPDHLSNEMRDRMGPIDTGDLGIAQPNLLVDTHVIFAPLLDSLGLENKRTISELLSLSGSASVLGGIEELRVEIFESEWNQQSSTRRKNKNDSYRSKSGGGGKFTVFIPPDVPAFLCERMSIEIEVKQMSDGRLQYQRAAGFLGQAFLKPQRTTALNFSLSVGYIAQQVNMPLLRLLHQLSSVYVNAKTTQVQLREQRPPRRGVDHLRALAVILDSAASTPSPQVRPEPSPSILSDPTNFPSRSFRPSSLAQRFRSGTRLSKGYTSMDEPLLVINSTDPVAVPTDIPDQNAMETTSNGTRMPHCWKTIYHLLELYASMTAASVVNKQHSIVDPMSVSGGPAPPASATIPGDVELGMPSSSLGEQRKSFVRRNSNVERVRLAVFGIMKINRVRLLAMLSGLRLESEIVSLHSSLTYKEKVRTVMPSHKVVGTAPSTVPSPPKVEFSLTGHLGKAMIVLLEGVAPSQQTVVKITVGKSQALYSSLSNHHTKDKNSGLLSVGAVLIDIPQHPVVLHGMMTRGTKQLSSTLQEFRVPRLASRAGRNTSTIPDEVDNSCNVPHSLHSPPKETPPIPDDGGTATSLLQPLVMQFSVVLQRLSITAALLPSLQAQYQMEHVVSAGVTGSKAKFTVDLPRHSLSFTTKLQITQNLPPSASIELPQVHVGAEYLQDSATTEEFVDGVVLCRGNYLSALAEIGSFEHCLTTDLLNHLVFVQKVFMAEVNDVLMKVSGGDKPVPLWEDAVQQSPSSMRLLLYNLIVRLKGIQITATTPTNTAVRLETGLVELQLSNRVQNVSGSKSHIGRGGRGRPATPTEASRSRTASRPAKLFGRAKVDLNLSLGQLIRNPLFEEAEPEFQQVAFFKTRISLRNAFQDELTPIEASGDAADKEVVLITLTRPLIYLQPVAVDKAILVWLNYKNAYDYWTEQRGGWIKETGASTIPDKVPQLGNLTSQLGSANLATLFVQLTVDDMGICMPLNTVPCSWSAGNRHISEPDTCSAVVVTLENSSISACSSGSLVSTGRFTGLCLRFADDFETGLDDWKPDMDDPAIMNLCVVSEGTYEVCSRTVTPPQHSSENAKWILHVGWQMEGVDTHFDTAIGKQFSALGQTLTRLTGGEEEDTNLGGTEMENLTGPSTDDDIEDGESTDLIDGREKVQLRRRRARSERAASHTEGFGLSSKGSRRRSRLIEKEMSEQARIIQDLRSLGASSATVEQEMRRLQELEAQASKDFRRVMLQRLKRQSIKTSDVANQRPVTQHGLHHTQSQRLPHHYHGLHQRSKSVVVPPVIPDVNVPNLSESGGSDEVLLRDVPRLFLPTIEGSPPMSCTATPTSEAQRNARLAASVGTNIHSEAGTNRSMAPSPVDHERTGLGAMGENQSNSGSKNAGEPSVDLELDIKVFINSGKCVLHTRDPRGEEMLKRMKKERSFSSSLLDTSGHQPSPVTGRKRHELRQIASSSRLKFMTANTAQLAVDLTIFHIPGLNVKVYYESKTIHEDSTSLPLSTGVSPASSVNRVGRMLTKKGSLFTWMTLHSIPEETIISPHILEFLEQALEPIPITMPESKPVSSNENAGIAGVFHFDGSSSTGVSGVSSTGGASGSFPVDVVVYCHVQPSTFRFSCLPVSRVECLLRLPSLHLVFSSKRSEDNWKEEFNTKPANAISTVGGLSVTGCLSDFSLYIFHPYGGGKKGGTSRREGNLSDRNFDAESERKDSLSVNVEFVKFHLSRSRKVNLVPLRPDTSSTRNGRDSAIDPAKAVVRFSTLIDIGSASFKYDMRRLPEILAFPKAWYRRTIVRRLFLGDLSKNDPSDLLPPSGRDLAPGLTRWAELQPDQSDLAQNASWETLVVFAVNFTKLNVHMNMGNVMGNVSWLTKDFKAEGRLSIGSTGHKDMYIGIGLEGSGLDAKGGIVGGTIELSGIHTSLAIHEDPGTEPDHRLAVQLRALECRLDYMGTSVLMGRVSDLAVDLRDEWRMGDLTQNEKVHVKRTSLASLPTKRPAMIFIHGDLGWDQLQLMMSKSTTADIIKMYLKLDEFFQQQFRSSRRLFSTLHSATSLRRKGPSRVTKSLVESNLEVQHHQHWQEVLRRVAGLQVATLPTPLPSTGTILGGTMELHGAHISLACFHGVNFKSKSWALFSLKDPCISFATEAQEIPGEDPKNIHVVQNLSFSLGLTSPGSHTPAGISYRVLDQQQQQQSPASMATVCRISRTQLFPPQFRTLQDWFLYAFAESRLDAVEKFPSLERERERATLGAANQAHANASVKTLDYNHTAEVIFAFPSLQLHLKSEHLQSGKVPLLTEEKPVVDCSFITDFEDHILVTVDAEAFFFLHDLITSYVREKDRVILASAASSLRTQSPELQKAALNGAAASTAAANANLGPPTDATTVNPPSNTAASVITTEDEKKRRLIEQVDWRTFQCKTWHLEPTVRLLSWAGKRIEPYGVDYILHKLGFSHARTTIPKWVQRGAMDPLDKVLSLVLLRTIAAQRANESNSQTTQTKR